jgi:hypothetical protein
MSVPPPPGAGDFFGAPSSPPPPSGQFGYGAPAAATPSPTMSYPFGTPQVGYGAPGAPSSHASSRPSGHTPELVIVACTLLGVFAAVGLYVAAAVTSISTAIGAFSSGVSAGESGSGPHLGAYAVIWGFCGVVNIALAYFLRQGNPAARIAASLVCAGWTLYWLRDLVDIARASTAAAGTGIGSIIGVAELLMLGLAIASALPAVVLWLPSTKDHFA